jgi:hypothetical protein
VKRERTRLWDNASSPKEADTELGREIRRRTDAPSVAVNRIVQRMAKQALQSEAGGGEKPNSVPGDTPRLTCIQPSSLWGILF